MKFLVLLSIVLPCFLVQANSEEFRVKLVKALHTEGIEGVKKVVEEVKKLAEEDRVDIINSDLLDGYGHTLMHFAAQSGDNKFVQDLLALGGDPYARNKRGEVPLHHAGSRDVAETFVSAGVKPDVVDNFETTPLHTVEHFADGPEVTDFLISVGANVKARNNWGETPLHRARFPESIDNLVGAGADVDARSTEEEYTPLHTLTGRADPKLAEALIKGGADPRLKDKNGKLPYVVRKNPRLLFLSNKIKKKSETYCRYLNNSSQIEAVQCGKRSICMAEVSCLLNIGIGSNRDVIGRKFHAVCSSLSNGECPEAIDCVLDRSVVEKKTKTEKPSSSTSAPKTSSKGVR